MATDKKSFVLYCDQQNIFKLLPDDVAGKLIKHIFAYVNDENPECTDLVLQLAFEPIKLQLKRDLKHWEGVREKRAESGKLGGRPKKQTEAKKANGFFEKQTKAKKAVNVNVNVTDNVNVNDTVNVINKEISYYRQFDHLKITQPEFDKLVAEGWLPEQVDNILSRIENYAQNKTYKSLYLTARNWLQKEPKTGLIPEHRRRLVM
jgi:hypothetical protein